MLTDYRLHIQYTGTYGVLIEGGGAMSENTPLRLWDSGTGTNNINVFEFGHATGSAPNRRYVPGARIKSTNPSSGATTGAHLILETSPLSNPDSTTWNTNQLYLRNDGNVGIGTNIPTSYLTINTPGGGSYSGGSAGDHAILIGSQSSGSVGAYIGTDETFSAMYIQSGIRGGAAASILLNAQGGNIGIGVTTPAAKLHAVTNVSSIPLIIASGSTTVDLVRITQVGTGNALVVEDSVNTDSSPFVVTNSGLVGIGISSPTASLHIKAVVGTTASLLMKIDGNSGELLTVVDSLTGSLMSVNDISGLPVLEVFDDNTVLMGNYQAPGLYTTTKSILGVVSNQTLYQISTSIYTSAIFEYNVQKSTSVRAGTILAVWNGTTLEFTETSTADIGSTSDISFDVVIGGAYAIFRTTTLSTGWTVKSIIRSI